MANAGASLGQERYSRDARLLYLRLNGYFVNGFIVHSPRGARTEMDVLAVRFPRFQEPEREVHTCERLAIPSENIDFVVGEVKGGADLVNFNVHFRNDPKAIRTVLYRFGAFADAELDRVCATVQNMLEPAKLKRSTRFPELDVDLCEAVGKQKGKLRFIPFAAEQRRPTVAGRPYLFEDDLIGFIWRCFRPMQQRQQCDVRYNFELWGPQFVQMVRYFKDTSRAAPGTIQDIYQFYGA